MDCSLPGFSVHGVSQQEYWSGLPFPTPGDLPDPGIKPASPVAPALAGKFFITEPRGKPTLLSLTQLFFSHIPPISLQQSSILSPQLSGLSENWFFKTSIKSILTNENFCILVVTLSDSVQKVFGTPFLIWCLAHSIQFTDLLSTCSVLLRRRQWPQHSCLENPMDGGAGWAVVHGVTKSRTRLSNFTFTFHFHALEKEMATHSSVLAWRIPGTVEPGGLPSMGLHRVGHDWSNLAAAAAVCCWGEGVYKDE